MAFVAVGASDGAHDADAHAEEARVGHEEDSLLASAESPRAAERDARRDGPESRLFACAVAVVVSVLAVAGALGAAALAAQTSGVAGEVGTGEGIVDERRRLAALVLGA